MAADKSHLANINKDFKLVPTDQKTDAGKIIYRNTETGELHSEISVTLEYPKGSGNWINVPSLLNGKVYTDKGVLALLKSGKLTPTSTHASEFEALEAAQFRSNNLNIQPASEDELIADGVERDEIGRIVEPLMANGSPSGRGRDVYMSDVSIATASKGVSDDDAINAQQAILEDVALSNDLASTYPTETENPDGLFVVNDNNNNIDLLRSQTSRIAAQEKQGELDAKAANERASLEKMYQIMDRAQSEKDDSYFYNPDNPDLNTPWKNWNAKYRMGDILRGTGLKGAENPTMNRYTQTPVSAADQAMFDNAKEERRILHMGNAMSSYGPRSTPEMDTGKGSNDGRRGPISRSKYVISEDNESFDIPILGNDTVTDGSKSRFKYKPHMTPEQKMKDNRNLKGLTPDYGEMPGFKKAENGNYWSADENSEFWKTDAGYEKAVETWGASGNPLPAYVKKPARKELDVQAIKNFFKPNR